MSLESLLDESISSSHVELNTLPKKVPFPQANSLERIIDTVINIDEYGGTTFSLQESNVVNNERQASYYLNACIFLGFIEKRGLLYFPTDIGKKIQKTNSENRNKIVASIMISETILKNLYCGVFSYNSYSERINWLKTQVDLGGAKADATINRRLDVVYKWLQWIQKNLPNLTND